MRQFKLIDPTKTEEQALVDITFPSYNFDVIDGVEYEIDVTKPAKYDSKGNPINTDSSRITMLTFNGKPADENQKFIVATNNYRAADGGNFPNINSSKVIIDSPNENRQVVTDYIKELGEINPSADKNWTFSPATGTVVTFKTLPEAAKYADIMENLAYVETLESGFAKYTLALSATVANDTPKPAEPKVDTKEKTIKEQPSTPQAKETVYTVKSGDTLFQIGKKHNVYWMTLATFNNLKNPNLILVGEKIRIPN